MTEQENKPAALIIWDTIIVLTCTCEGSRTANGGGKIKKNKQKTKTWQTLRK